MPRSITQIRSALPYCVSILFKNSLSVVLSEVFPANYFIGERKTLGADDQCDDHLHAVRSLIAAIAVAALILWIVRRIGLEISAGQIVKQHVKLGLKQILPALSKMTEQRSFMLKHFVQTAIQRIFLC